MGLFDKKPKALKTLDTAVAEATVPAEDSPGEPALTLPDELLWLLDAPLFIDGNQVDAFYDAILRPDYEETAKTLSATLSKETTFSGGLELGVALPWFGKTGVHADAEHATGSGQGREVSLSRISNAYRHLIALALHYATQKTPDRLVVAEPGTTTVQSTPGTTAVNWLDPGFIEAVPRALVFLELPPQSRLIPAALELANGEVTVLADALGTRLAGGEAMRYPGSEATTEEEAKYFEWFARNFDHHKALEIVEQAVKDRQIAWIDFNVSIAGDSRTAPPFMHLHLAGHGTYDTGVFGYNFIARGFKHGLRVVGTLKSGPDLNVLAVFER